MTVVSVADDDDDEDDGMGGGGAGSRYSNACERMTLRSESVHLNIPRNMRVSVVVMRRVLLRSEVR